MTAWVEFVLAVAKAFIAQPRFLHYSSTKPEKAVTRIEGHRFSFTQNWFETNSKAPGRANMKIETLAALIVCVLLLYRLLRWEVESKRAPDPWDAEVEREV